MPAFSKPRGRGGCACHRGRVSSPAASGGARHGRRSHAAPVDDRHSLNSSNSDSSDARSSSDGSTRDTDARSSPSSPELPVAKVGSEPLPSLALAKAGLEPAEAHGDGVSSRPPARVCRPGRVCGLGGLDLGLTALLPQWPAGVCAAPLAKPSVAPPPQWRRPPGWQEEAPAAAPPATTGVSATTRPVLSPPKWEGQIRELMALRDAEGPLAQLSDFAKEYGDEAFCMRLLRKYDGDMRKCANQYSQALRWRERNEELLTTRKFQLAGDYRVIGADTAQRPMLYMCLKNQLISNAAGLDQSLVVLLQAIDNMPAGVENTIHIWDCHGIKVHLNMNPAPLVRMAQAQEGYFAERLHELIIVDMPRVATFLKDAVWGFLPEKTRRKIKFMTPEECKAHVQRSCEDATATRICEAIAENRNSSIKLEQRKRSWLRAGPRGELLPMCE